MFKRVVNNPMYRPPAEASSLILQLDHGCPYNSCAFCGMYKGVEYQRLSIEEIRDLVIEQSVHCSTARRIFLADGDVLRRSFDDLHTILTMLNEYFPKLARVGLYANGSSINAKTEDELSKLKSLKLHTLYMGLESGDEGILKVCKKGETVSQMVDAGIKAQDAGLRMSVMVLIGLGGADATIEHATHTAEAVNKMQPRLLSALRVIPVKGTELYDETITGRFHMLTEYQAIQELRNMIADLELASTVFRANHSSNVVPVEARFPRDKDRLLNEMDQLLSSGSLDTSSPGSMPNWL